MNRSVWLGLLASFALLLMPSFVHAQAGYQVVASCPGVKYPVGPVRPGTQDTTGTLCTQGGSGGGVVTGNQSNAGAGTTGSANVGTSSYNYGWNVAAGDWLQVTTASDGSWLVSQDGSWTFSSADCGIATLGCKADAAWVSGSGTGIAILKTIAVNSGNPLATQAQT